MTRGREPRLRQGTSPTRQSEPQKAALRSALPDGIARGQIKTLRTLAQHGLVTAPRVNPLAGLEGTAELTPAGQVALELLVVSEDL